MRARHPSAISVCARCVRIWRAVHLPGAKLRSNRSAVQPPVIARTRSTFCRMAPTGSRSPRYLLYWVAGGMSERHLHDRFRAAVLVENLGQQPLAEGHLRLGVVGLIALVLDHFEPQVVEGATH